VNKPYYNYDQLPILLDINEAAKLLRCSTKKVSEMLRDGWIRGFKVGRAWRIAKKDVIRFIEEECYHAGDQV
jgi:excisionase family DNA binding protein